MFSCPLFSVMSFPSRHVYLENPLLVFVSALFWWFWYFQVFRFILYPVFFLLSFLPIILNTTWLVFIITNVSSYLQQLSVSHYSFTVQAICHLCVYVILQSASYVSHHCLIIVFLIVPVCSAVSFPFSFTSHLALIVSRPSLVYLNQGSFYLCDFILFLSALQFF